MGAETTLPPLRPAKWAWWAPVREGSAAPPSRCASASGGADQPGFAITLYPALEAAVLAPWQKEQLVRQPVQPTAAWQAVQEGPPAPP